MGALSRGDVDLHLRVAPLDFAATVEVLTGTYRPVHREIWQPTLATFEVAGDIDTGVAVTPAGSGHDIRFTISWARLSQEPDLLDRYNAMKRSSTADDYEARKSWFFDELDADGRDQASLP